MKQAFASSLLVVLLLWAPTGLAAVPSPAQTAARKFELRGRVLLPPGTIGPRRWIAVNLLAVGSPYYSRTQVRQGGNFKFKKLLPGTYTIHFSIPRIGSLTRTVEVTSSFANPKGIVEKQFEFTPELMRLLLRPEERGTVSVRELKITYGARREFERAQGRLRDKDGDGAIEHFLKAIEESEGYLEAFNSLGIIYFQRGNYEEAEKYFNKALALDENAFEPRLNLGGVLLTQGKANEALEANLRAYEIYPQDALASAQLGLSYYLLSQFGQAIQYLDHTKELDPAHFTFPQITLAQIFLRLEQPEAAIEELKEFLQLHPDSAEASRANSLLARTQQAVQQEELREAETDGP